MSLTIDCARFVAPFEPFAKCSHTRASTPCSPKCFPIISNSRSVSLPKWFSATMTGQAVVLKEHQGVAC
jgi:hypothetical protein